MDETPDGSLEDRKRRLSALLDAETAPVEKVRDLQARPLMTVGAPWPSLGTNRPPAKKDLSEDEVSALWRQRADACDSDEDHEDDEEEAPVPSPRLLKIAAELDARRERPAAPRSADPSRNTTVPATTLTVVRHEPPPRLLHPVPIDRAAVLLRSDLPADAAAPETARFRWFRAEVLPRWLQNVPEREQCGLMND
jgi:hypothetical protein